MGKLIVLICILNLLPINGNAQYDRRNYVFSSDSDTIYWYQIRLSDEAKYNLDSIHDNTADTSFRISWPGTAIDIYRNDTIIHGYVNIFAEEHSNNLKTGKTFKLTFTLTSKQANEIWEIIGLCNLNNIASESHMGPSRVGSDGTTYCIQQKSAGVYSFKNYWSPKFDGPSGLAIIANLVEQIKKISRYTELENKFRKNIPFYFFTNGDAWVGIKSFD